MKKKPVRIKVLLRPSDFKGNSYCEPDDCALARAGKRHFKEDVSCDDETFSIYKEDRSMVNYKILNDFDYDDFLFVKEQYEKDPKMKKAEYFVTLELC